MSIKTVLVLVIGFYSVCAGAQPTAREPQSREWTEKLPSGGWFEHSDRYVNYERDGKVVFRTVARRTTVKGGDGRKISEFPEQKLEFVVDRNVIASIGLDKAIAASWDVTSGAPVHFSSGGVPGSERRFFHLFVPKYDYYEYLEVSGTEVKLLPETNESYAARKRGFAKLIEKGYIRKLDE